MPEIPFPEDGMPFDVKKYQKEYRDSNKEKLKEYQRRYYQNNKEKVLSRQRQYNAKNKEVISERAAEYYKQNREHIKKRSRENGPEYARKNRDRVNTRQRKWRKTPMGQKKTRNKKLKSKYGITETDYNAMLLEQKGVCAICGQVETRICADGSSHLSVDHNHSTGKVRGLLCNTCNTMIGLGKDSVDVLAKAIVYLEKERLSDGNTVPNLRVG